LITNAAPLLVPGRNPDYAFAKYEEIITKPIKPTYDGSSDNLVPFLNRLEK
jgi:hypothetical protein